MKNKLLKLTILLNKIIHFSYWLARKVLLVYWWIFRPETKGVKVIFIKDNEVLMVRLSYFKSDKWTFPGGGVDRGESIKEAAKRECIEEVGIEPSNLEFVGTAQFTDEFKRDTVHVFRNEVNDYPEIRIDDKEIIEADWFLLDDLPSIGKNAKSIFNLLK